MDVPSTIRCPARPDCFYATCFIIVLNIQNVFLSYSKKRQSLSLEFLLEFLVEKPCLICNIFEQKLISVLGLCFPNTWSKTCFCSRANGSAFSNFLSKKEPDLFYVSTQNSCSRVGLEGSPF